MKLRWGIVGAGRIVHRMLAGFALYPEAEFAGIYSRTKEKAEDIAETYGGAEVYDTFEEMITSPDIDAIYVAVPHAFHKEYALAAAKAGKHVLCEKALTVSAKDAEEMFDSAKENNVLLMEGLWTRCFPTIKQVRKWIADGEIGEVKNMHATFGLSMPKDYSDRLWDINAAGGALLDLGIYLLGYINMVMPGMPSDITSVVRKHDNGVDCGFGLALMWEGGKIATAAADFLTKMHNCVDIYGEKGSIHVSDLLCNPRHVCMTNDKGVFDYATPEGTDPGQFEGEGFQFELAHFHELVEAGEIDSPLMSHEDSVTCLKICDKLRKDWGLVYPFE